MLYICAVIIWNYVTKYFLYMYVCVSVLFTIVVKVFFAYKEEICGHILFFYHLRYLTLLGCILKKNKKKKHRDVFYFFILLYMYLNLLYVLYYFL